MSQLELYQAELKNLVAFYYNLVFNIISFN